MQTELLDAAHSLPEEDWARLDTGGDPFASRAFLGSFDELSGARVDDRNGETARGEVGAGETAPDSFSTHPALSWQPAHILLRDATGTPAAMLPMYRRQHSFGDFSHDWGWADAWHQAGLRYYPKLVSGIPYTPSPGPRLLIRTDFDHTEWAMHLIQAALASVQALGASSWQCLFADERDRAVLVEAGCLLRRGVQFHWRNAGYRDFDDFLSTFTADKRKKLKRERRAVSEANLVLEVRHGNDIDLPLWKQVHTQYRDTFARHGNHPALPLQFFVNAGARLGQQLLVFLAHDATDRQLVASAICYRDGSTLYGRHWGCTRQIPGLHFELCYYQGIEYCIHHGLNAFEPGAQGEHKLARGFAPHDTWSAFWIADSRLRAAVASYLAREDIAMRDYAAETAAHLPFRVPI